jgi:hypothetical protein
MSADTDNKILNLMDSLLADIGDALSEPLSGKDFLKATGFAALTGVFLFVFIVKPFWLAGRAACRWIAGRYPDG